MNPDKAFRKYAFAAIALIHAIVLPSPFFKVAFAFVSGMLIGLTLMMRRRKSND